MEYKIIPFEKKYLPQLTSLLDRSFHITNASKRQLVRWKYYAPYHEGETVTYIALDKRGDVVGQYTNAPVQVVRSNRIYRAMVCMDMTTRDDHRGQGIISALSKKVYATVSKRGYDFSIGFSNDSGVVVDKNAKGYGYQLVGKFVRYITWCHAHRKTPYRIIAQKKSLENRQKHTNNPHFFTIHKTSNYLQWRYEQKPHHEYLLFRLVHGVTTRGSVVLHFTRTRCYVFDIIAPLENISRAKHILTAIENECVRRKKRFVIYHVLGNDHWEKIFSSIRYIKKRKSAVNYFFTIKIHSKILQKSTQLLDPNAWLLMNGDVL